MTSPESEEFRPVTLQELQNITANVEQEIDQELSQLDNQWLECLGSYIFGLSASLKTLRSFGGTNEITMKKVSEMEQKLEDLKSRAKDIKKQHGLNPPEELRKELIKMLKDIV